MSKDRLSKEQARAPKSGLANPIYLVGRHVFSMHDLLRRFTEKQYMRGDISRISDMHLKVGDPVRYRFDSDLVALPEAAPLTQQMIEALVFPMLSDEQVRTLQDKAQPSDIDTSYDWPEEALSFRLNVFHDREGLACAIRVLPRAIPELSKIGFPSSALWKEIVHLKQGLVIVTGVTGSGKSTTISSLIQYINRHQKRRIITLEDPIEYILPSDRCLISQRELGKHISSLPKGLRSALREDPDIIFVGEMRDPETASLALTAAETGHLVFSTLHTRDARGTLSRLVDMYPAERIRELTTQLSFSLTMVVAQKLVPRADQTGRVVAMEVLKNVPAVSHMIRAGNWHQIYSTMETNAKEGLITMEAHLVELASRGVITRENALAYANDKSIRRRIAGA